MLKTGSWRIDKKSNKYIVLDVYPDSAYVYLWHKGDGILSHVWLFNCDAKQQLSENTNGENIPKPMPIKNLICRRYKVPSTIEEISCEHDAKLDVWNIYINNLKVASLNERQIPGESIFVKKSNELAQKASF